MNVENLTQLVGQGESDILEFKLTTGQRREAARTACGMLNGSGGHILFGVSDRGGIVGQAVTANTAEDLVNELRRIEPSPPHSVESVEMDNGKSVLILSIPKADGGPYTYDGRPYMRRGPTTSVMPQSVYEQLMMDRMEASRRWENRVAQGVTIEDLDGAEIVRTVEEAIRRQRLDDPGTRDVNELLLGLGLIQRGQILNAAVVLFGKQNSLLPNYTQCLLRMARFSGREKTEDFLDNRQELGNTFDLLRRAQRFFRDHLPVAGRIVPGVYERVDDPLYPPVALREAVANALCHRNYGIPGGAVNIAIFDDRVEISSTGALPSGVTLEALSQPHNSQPRNPLIAQAFYRSGVIESWGRGTLKMIEQAAQAGLPPPEFEAGEGEVLVRFRAPEERHIAVHPTPSQIDASTKASPSIPNVLRVEFVTRKDREGNDLAERLKQELSPTENRMVALWGAGGVGKTTLAAQVARSLGTDYAQRVVWVSADGREDFNLGTLLDEIATQLGRPDLRQQTLELKKAQVRDALLVAPTLIVLDNFETIRPEEGEISIDWLSQSGLGSALITTRQYVEKARNIPVGPMTPEEANDFLRRLTAQVYDPGVFENLDFDRVIRTAEGNPLVLQWIVGQIALAQDPEEVLDELTHGEGDAAQRVFDRSYNLPQLSMGGRAVLLALSMFVPSATRPALAEVAGMGKDKDKKRFKQAVATLSALWLIRATSDQRLAVEGVTRELAKARLSRDPRSKIFRQRFIARFLRYAESHKRPTPGDLNALESEKGNLLNAIDIAQDFKDWRTVVRIQADLDNFLDLRGYWNEAVRYGEQAASAARNLDDELAAAQFAERAAVIRMRQGEYDSARHTFEQVLSVYRQLGSDVNVSVTLHNLARVAQEMGDRLEARRLYSESLELSKALGDRTSIADSLEQLGRIAQTSGELEEAKRLYVKSLELSRNLGDAQGIASSLHNLGNLEYERHALDEARHLYQESLSLSDKLGDQQYIARTLHQLGLISMAEGNKAEAIRMLREALSIFNRLGSPYAEVTRRELEELGSDEMETV